MNKLSPRDCVDVYFFARMICCPIVSKSRTHGGWWCRVFFFFLLPEMRDLNKLTSRLEFWRRECLILVNISMFCNRCKNLLEETSAILLNITALLVRLAQTITKIYRNKIPWCLFPRKKIIVILLACTTICSTLIIVLHQAGGLLPTVD